jgi:uncharacterized damage-inducible protein DinB
MRVGAFHLEETPGGHTDTRCPPDLRETVLAAWRTNNRVTLFLFEHLPSGLWAASVPGAPRRTIRMIAGHIHNARCTWIKVLGQPHGLPVPTSVDRRRVGARQLLPALRRSGHGIGRLLQLGCRHGGTIPATRSYVWRNLPLDVGHILGYFIAHEGHHRGQIVLAARALGHRLPRETTSGLWQWSKRAAEAAAAAAS